MSDSRQRLGKRGEEMAKRHLQAIGYRILEANHRAKAGEIDLVAEKDGALVFVEVRARTGAAIGSPEESITPRKRSHMVDAAQEYLQSHDVEGREWRIDLVALEFSPGGRLVRLDVLENPVEV
jgi:putative endonuclease